MPTMLQPPPPMQLALGNLLDEAIRRVIGGEPLASFCAWFVAQLTPAMEMAIAPGADDTASARRLVLTMARHFWRDVPMPNNHWRPQSLPKIERNDRCYCGSGRKFKQCCADLADMPPVLNAENALGLVMGTMAPEQVGVAALRQVPPAALAVAAMAMCKEHGDAHVAALLEPLFLQPAGLDARYEDAFEVLMDTLLNLGQETRREQVVQAVIAHSTDKNLATSARCRRVVMLTDRGDYAQAWTVFHEAQRLNPNDPQLWHLEMLTLLGEGRDEEARVRAPLLAARARKLGFPDLEHGLLDLGRKGLAAVAGLGADNEMLDDEEQSWVELLSSAPTTQDAAHCSSLYTVESLRPLDGQSEPMLQLHACKALQAIEKRWRKAFPVETPWLMDLESAADVILDDPHDVMAFLDKYPDAWCSLQVQDDLLLAAREMVDTSDAQALSSGARALAAHAVAVCRAVLGDTPGQVVWIMPESRPFLRVIAQAITFALQARDDAAAQAWMRWSLALNPHDNHGWREPVVARALESGQADEALAWLDRYPDDRPPADHQRALAQFMLGDAAAAEVTLRAAHARVPAMVAALMPEVFDAPPMDDGPGVEIGSADHAYEYRAMMRPVWVRTRALAWLQTLDLPQPRPRAAAKTRAKAKKVGTAPGTGSTAPSAMLNPEKPLSTAQEKRLRQWFPDMPRLRGYLTAIAWSPGVVVPSKWITPLMELLHAAQDSGAKKAPTMAVMNSVLGDLMQLYNQLNGMVLTHDPERLPDAMPSQADVFRWAAGFVQAAELCAGPWRGAGFAVKNDQMPFKALFALAALAPADPDAWRATDGDGQPVLTGVSADPPPPIDLLTHALLPLWWVIAPMRRQRVRP